MRFEQIALELLDEPSNPHRHRFDQEALSDLASNIQLHGLIEPLIVTPRDGGRFEVKAGHRRLLACRLARLNPVPCMVREESEEQLEAIKFAENSHRENLTPWEEALALKEQQEAGKCSAAGLARMMSRSYAWVSARLALLDYPEDIQEQVRCEQLSLAHAAQLSRVDDPEHRKYLTTYTIMSGANAGVIASWVQQWETQRAIDAAAPVPRPEMTSAIQVPVVLMLCEVCREQHQAHDLTIIRACPSCNAALRTGTAP